MQMAMEGNSDIFVATQGDSTISQSPTVHEIKYMY